MNDIIRHKEPSYHSLMIDKIERRKCCLERLLHFWRVIDTRGKPWIFPDIHMTLCGYIHSPKFWNDFPHVQISQLGGNEPGGIHFKSWGKGFNQPVINLIAKLGKGIAFSLNFFFQILFSCMSQANISYANALKMVKAIFVRKHCFDLWKV